VPGPGEPAAAAAAAPGPGALQVAWHAAGEGGAPVFSAPAVVTAAEGGGSGDSGGGGGCQLVVVGHVDGHVRALRAADGRKAWRAQLRGQLFADLCTAPGPGLGGAGGAAGGACLLAATHGGRAYCLAAADGSQARGAAACAQGDKTASHPSPQAPASTPR
jgi:outer membrane protein assembly factor BamB